MLVALLMATVVQAEDAFYEIPINELSLTEGKIPGRPEEREWRWNQWNQPRAYAVLDGRGEIYLGPNIGRAWQNARGFNRNEETFNTQAVAIRADKGQKVTGRIFFPHERGKAMVAVKFEVQPEKASPTARKNFLLAKESHYQHLLDRQYSGAAWFRYQLESAKAERLGKPLEESLFTQDPQQRPIQTTSELEDTYNVFSGGRAVSENLQLDRLIRPTKPEEGNIPIEQISEITVAEMEWAPLIEDKSPELDSLAMFIPADQHALFFPSFQAMTTVMDEAAAYGTPALQLFQERSESAQTREKYEQQLCLKVDALSRLLGPQFINSVAFTGDDPYLRTGTGVAILFDTKAALPIQNFILAKQQAAIEANSEVKMVQGSVAGVPYVGAVSPRRDVCSYLAIIDNVVIVTNSPVQIERCAQCKQGTQQCLAKLPEFTFFRDRYARGNPEESCFLIVTDQTIRRWCGPKWRIAASRRTRAAAIMSHIQAEHLDELTSGKVEDRLVQTRLYVPEMGTLRLTSDGVTSSTYNTMEFLTPISELELTHVSAQEQESYERWRNTYQNYWRQFFDPIAVSLSVKDGKLTADTTVMPLIEQTEYASLMRWTEGAEIKPHSGDPHPGALIHMILAINIESDELRWARNFMETTFAQGQTNALSWMGESVSLYVDQDPFWLDAAKAEDPDKFIEQNIHRLPAAIEIEVKNSLKLSLFLTGLRGFIQQAAPDLTTWETLKHNERSYVKIAPTEAGRQGVGVPDQLAIFYAATPRRLVFSFNEDLIKRVLDREIARDKGEKIPGADKLDPWMGKNAALKIDETGIQLFDRIFANNLQSELQRRAWANIHILNEWKRLYPDRDPVKFHEEYWQTRLISPSNGEYVWNEDLQTMESTVYGSPANPKEGPTIPEELQQAKSVAFGLTFEHKGLRAKVEIERKQD